VTGLIVSVGLLFGGIAALYAVVELLSPTSLRVMTRNTQRSGQTTAKLIKDFET